MVTKNLTFQGNMAIILVDCVARLISLSCILHLDVRVVGCYTFLGTWDYYGAGELLQKLNSHKITRSSTDFRGLLFDVWRVQDATWFVRVA